LGEGVFGCLGGGKGALEHGGFLNIRRMFVWRAGGLVRLENLQIVTYENLQEMTIFEHESDTT
jgi:hypothetical protein